MVRLFIIAGNHQQFRHYIRDKENRLDFVYVSSVHLLRGIQNPKGVFIGTWYEREDLGEILMQLRLAGVEYEKILEIMQVRVEHVKMKDVRKASPW